MRMEHPDNRLDDLIHAAVGGDEPSFDFQQWKVEHARSVEDFRLRQGPAGRPRSFLLYVSRHHRPAAGLLAAAAVLAIAMLLLLGDGQQTVCARTLQAIELAQSLHVVQTEYRDGQRVKNREIWYDRQAGVREEERYEGRTDVRIDNGQYEWRYACGGKYAGRQRSYRDIDEMLRDLCAGWLNYTPRRVASGDMTIAGVPCRMYVIADSGWSCSLWADEKDRVRRAEVTQEDRPWDGKTLASIEIEYDTAITPERFEPQFDAGVEVVDPRRFLEQQYPLETALFTREGLGFTFAVHRLERCAGGFKLMVCSIRLTDEARRKIEATHPWTFSGSADLREVSEGAYFDRIEGLAALSNAGIRVSWYLLLPGGDKAAETAGCDVNVDISTANRLEEKLKADGLPTREQFRLVIPKERVRQTRTRLEDYLSEIYSLGEQLDPIVHIFLLEEVIKDRNVRVGRRPGIELSRDSYIRNVQQRVSNWLERN
ncbi:MAG: hypothetical protein ACM3VT_16640 [Solirubrobacterales bacterium]